MLDFRVAQLGGVYPQQPIGLVASHKSSLNSQTRIGNLLPADIKDFLPPYTIAPFSQVSLEFVFAGFAQIATASFMVELDVVLPECQELVGRDGCF